MAATTMRTCVRRILPYHETESLIAIETSHYKNIKCLHVEISSSIRGETSEWLTEYSTYHANFEISSEIFLSRFIQIFERKLVEKFSSLRSVFYSSSKTINNEIKCANLRNHQHFDFIKRLVQSSPRIDKLVVVGRAADNEL